MPIGLVAEAPEGFAGSYRKAAAYIGSPDDIPELRVSSPERGSFHLLVLAAIAVSQHADQPHLLGQAWDFVKDVNRKHTRRWGPGCRKITAAPFAQESEIQNLLNHRLTEIAVCLRVNTGTPDRGSKLTTRSSSIREH
jgi:hypothetical protein